MNLTYQLAIVTKKRRETYCTAKKSKEGRRSFGGIRALKDKIGCEQLDRRAGVGVEAGDLACRLGNETASEGLPAKEFTLLLVTMS